MSNQNNKLKTLRNILITTSALSVVVPFATMVAPTEAHAAAATSGNILNLGGPGSGPGPNIQNPGAASSTPASAAASVLPFQADSAGTPPQTKKLTMAEANDKFIEFKQTLKGMKDLDDSRFKGAIAILSPEHQALFENIDLSDFLKLPKAKQAARAIARHYAIEALRKILDQKQNEDVLSARIIRYSAAMNDLEKQLPLISSSATLKAIDTITNKHSKQHDLTSILDLLEYDIETSNISDEKRLEFKTKYEAALTLHREIDKVVKGIRDEIKAEDPSQLSESGTDSDEGIDLPTPPEDDTLAADTQSQAEGSPQAHTPGASNSDVEDVPQSTSGTPISVDTPPPSAEEAPTPTPSTQQTSNDGSQNAAASASSDPFAFLDQQLTAATTPNTSGTPGTLGAQNPSVPPSVISSASAQSPQLAAAAASPQSSNESLVKITQELAEAQTRYRLLEADKDTKLDAYQTWPGPKAEVKTKLAEYEQASALFVQSEAEVKALQKQLADLTKTLSSASASNSTSVNDLNSLQTSQVSPSTPTSARGGVNPLNVDSDSDDSSSASARSTPPTPRSPSAAAVNLGDSTPPTSAARAQGGDLDFDNVLWNSAPTPLAPASAAGADSPILTSIFDTAGAASTPSPSEAAANAAWQDSFIENNVAGNGDWDLNFPDNFGSGVPTSLRSPSAAAAGGSTPVTSTFAAAAVDSEDDFFPGTPPLLDYHSDDDSSSVHSVDLSTRDNLQGFAPAEPDPAHIQHLNILLNELHQVAQPLRANLMLIMEGANDLQDMDQKLHAEAKATPYEALKVRLSAEVRNNNMDPMEFLKEIVQKEEEFRLLRAEKIAQLNAQQAAAAAQERQDEAARVEEVLLAAQARQQDPAAEARQQAEIAELEAELQAAQQEAAAAFVLLAQQQAEVVRLAAERQAAAAEVARMEAERQADLDEGQYIANLFAEQEDQNPPAQAPQNAAAQAQQQAEAAEVVRLEAERDARFAQDALVLNQANREKKEELTPAKLEKQEAAALAEATENSKVESDPYTSTINALYASIVSYKYEQNNSVANKHESVNALIEEAIKNAPENDKEAAKEGIKATIHKAFAESPEAKQGHMNAATDDSKVASMPTALKEALLEELEGTTSISKKVTEQADLDPLHVTTKVVMDGVTHSIGARLGDLQVASNEGLGAAAGDDDLLRHNRVWLNGIYGSSKQGMVGSASGYKGKVFGGSIGVDTDLNDNLLVGIAYSNAVSKFKFKNSRSKDKTTAVSHVLSLYSQLEFAGNFVWNNIASVSQSNIKVTNARSNDSMARGKFKNKAFGLDTNLGYKIVQDNTTFIPNVGLRYNTGKDAAYNERGAGIFNAPVASQKSESLIGSIGGKVLFNQELENGIKLTPSLTGSVDFNLMNKVQTVRAKYEFINSDLDGKSAKGIKAPKVDYNIGAGLMASRDNIEVSANYNFNVAKKYQAHQGSVKLKVSF